MIVGNSMAGDPILMGGEDPSIVIPSVMVSLADASTIKAGLAANGRVSANPVPPPRPCHDTGVILGDAMLAGCAGGNGFTVWSLDPAEAAARREVSSHRGVPGREQPRLGARCGHPRGLARQ